MEPSSGKELVSGSGLKGMETKKGEGKNEGKQEKKRKEWEIK